MSPGEPRRAVPSLCCLVALPAAALGACLAGADLPAEPAGPTPAPPPATEPMVDDERVDQGAFVVSHRGRVIGAEQFAIDRRADGRLRIATRSRLLVDGTVSLRADSLLVDGDWRPLRYRSIGAIGTAPTAVSVRRDAGGQLVELRRAGPRLVVTRAAADIDLYLARNTLTHLTPLCRAGPAPARLRAFPNRPVLLRQRAQLTIVDADDRPLLRLIQIDVRADAASPVQIFCAGHRLMLIVAPGTSLAAARRSVFQILPSSENGHSLR